MKKYILILSLGFLLASCNFFGNKDGQTQINPILNTGSEIINTGSEDVSTGIQVANTGSVKGKTEKIINSGVNTLTGESLSGADKKEVDATLKEIDELINGIK